MFYSVIWVLPTKLMEISWVLIDTSRPGKGRHSPEQWLLDLLYMLGMFGTQLMWFMMDTLWLCQSIAMKAMDHSK